MSKHKRNVVAILKGTDQLIRLFESWESYDEWLVKDSTQYSEEDLTVCDARVH